MRISVALCTCNGAKFLHEQLDSMLRQERRPDELVVCDDGSVDRTAAILAEFAASAPFAVHVHANERRLGTTKNFETAFALCSGDIIAPCDQDDVWLPHKLARFEAAFATDPLLGLVICDGYLTDERLTQTGERIWPHLPFPVRLQQRFDRGEGARLLLRYNVVTGAASAFRAALRPSLLPIPECWVHDGWVGLLAAALGPVRTLPEPLILYRRHPGQQIGPPPRTLAAQLEQARRMDRAYCMLQLDCFQALAGRLRTIDRDVCDRGLLTAVEQKIAFAKSRVAMRDVNRLHRIVLAAGELLRGRYHRYGRGTRGFVADALL